MKNHTIRPDLLQVSTVMRNGNMPKIQLRGAAYLTVTKGFNEPTAQIAVEVQHSSGVGAFKTLHKHEKALINITFEDGNGWSGTFADLRKALKV